MERKFNTLTVERPASIAALVATPSSMLNHRRFRDSCGSSAVLAPSTASEPSIVSSKFRAAAMIVSSTRRAAPLLATWSVRLIVNATLPRRLAERLTYEWKRTRASADATR